MLDTSENGCQTCGCKIIQIYPSLCKYFFHSLVGQLDGVNFFNFDLKSPNDTDYLTACGNKLHIFGLYVMEFHHHYRPSLLFAH